VVANKNIYTIVFAPLGKLSQEMIPLAGNILQVFSGLRYVFQKHYAALDV
jgi:hypothetical protein